MGVEIVFRDNLKEVMGKIDETARARMLESVQEVRNTTLETLSGPRTGREYYVPGTRRIYTASAPGEPPASATGELRQSVKKGIEGQGAAVVGFVGTDMPYGPMLEFGTYQMAPRPWLRKSFEAIEARVVAIFARVWF